MKRTVTVTGVGAAGARPDLAEVTVTVEASDPEYRKCVASNSAKTDLLRSALISLGFDGDALKTRDFQVIPQYESRREQETFRQVFTGYSCVHRTVIRFDWDSESLARVIDAVTGCGADAEVGIRFTVKNAEELINAGITEAARSARRKAEVLCAASGGTLGKLISAEYRQDTPDLYSPTSYVPAGRMMAKMAGAETDIRPEDVQFRQYATLVWELV